MKQVSVALLEQDLMEGERIQQYGRKAADIQWCGRYFSCASMGQGLKNTKADVVIICLHDKNEKEFREFLQNNAPSTSLFMYADEWNVQKQRQWATVPLRYVLTKQASLEKLFDRVRMFGAVPTVYDQVYQSKKEEDVYLQEIASILKLMGVSPHLCGYRFLLSGVALVLEHKDWIEKMTTCLYPRIAEIHQSTPQRVERAMRYAVENAFDNGNLKAIEYIFGYTVDQDKGKPSNRECIARLADYVEMQLT